MLFGKKRKPGINSGLTNENKRVHMNKLANYRDGLRRAPELRSLFIEMTGLCNEHCRHCGSNCGDFAPVDGLTDEEICRFLDQIKEDFDIRDLKLCITGGEPLLRPGFFEIMEYAKSIGFQWGMTSNGTLIDKETAKKLKKAGLRTISISVDGLKENHEWFRQKQGSYDLTIQGVKNLVEVGIEHVQITTVVYPGNLKELPLMYKEFQKTGIRSWRVINVEPIGRAAKDPELMLTGEQYKELFEFIKEKRFASPMEVCYGCSHYLGEEMEREVRPWYFLCSAGVYTASVMYNGDIGACLDIERRPELIQGNIRKDRFSTVWETGYEMYRTDYRKVGKCAECKDYRFCAGDSFHTWNFDENRPNLCLKGILF